MSTCRSSYKTCLHFIAQYKWIAQVKILYSYWLGNFSFRSSSHISQTQGALFFPMVLWVTSTATCWIWWSGYLERSEMFFAACTVSELQEDRIQLVLLNLKKLLNQILDKIRHGQTNVQTCTISCALFRAFKVKCWSLWNIALDK